jgi:hypothetical protein
MKTIKYYPSSALWVRSSNLSQFRINFWKYDSFKHLEGRLRWRNGPSQGLYLHDTMSTEKASTYMHIPTGIRTQDLSVLATEDKTCLRLRDQWWHATVRNRIINRNTARFNGRTSYEEWIIQPSVTGQKKILERNNVLVVYVVDGRMRAF